jgi:hypothetical protein
VTRAGHLPSKETVEYARQAVKRVIDKYQRFEDECRAKGQAEQADRWRAVHWALTRDLYGYEDGGCVVVAFDQRWLDDEFRRVHG